MSGAEGQDPAGTDPIDLQLPRSATSSGTPQTSTPSVTRLSRHEEFVASDAISLEIREVFLVGNGPS